MGKKPNLSVFEKPKGLYSKPRKEKPRKTVVNFPVKRGTGAMTRSQATRRSADAAFGQGYLTGGRKVSRVNSSKSPLEAPKPVAIKSVKATTRKKGVKKSATLKAVGAKARKATITKTAKQKSAARKAADIRQKGTDAMKAGKLGKARRLARRYQNKKKKM